MGNGGNSMPIELAHLACSTRETRIRDKEVRDREMVKVFRGYYLPQSLVEEGAPPWVIQRVFSEARALARADSLGVSNPGVVTMEAALLMWGLNTWSATPDIHYWRQVQTRARASTMPPAVVRQVMIPEVNSHELTGVRLLGGGAKGSPNDVDPLNGTHGHSVRGVQAVGLGEAALDLTRFAHPLVAYYGVSNVLRHLTQYSLWQRNQSDARVFDVRSRLLERANLLDGRKKDVTLALLKSADPGVASPGEAQLLWLLHILLRDNSHPNTHFESQHEVIIDGRQYFIDVAFPEIRLALEFDGLGKMRREGAETDFRRRHADLSRAGWKLRHYPSEIARDPMELARLLTRDLTQMGLVIKPLGGPLWEHVSQDMMMAGRSNGTLLC